MLGLRLRPLASTGTGCPRPATRRTPPGPEGLDLVPGAARLRLRLHRAHRRRGGLRRRARLQAARGAERPHRADLARRHPGHAVPGHHLSGLRTSASSPRAEETVVSQLARLVFGDGLLYYEIQVVTMLILVLAANTAFADFPRLASFLARDRLLPRQFATAGDRLVFSNGILILAGLGRAADRAVPRRHPRADPALRDRRVHLLHALAGGHGAALARPGASPAGAWRLWFNALGAATTGLVMLVIAVTKFIHGAWIVVAADPAAGRALPAMHRHYDDVAGQLSLERYVDAAAASTHTVLVLVGDLHRGVVRGAAVRPDAGAQPRRRSTSRPIRSGRGGSRRSGASGGWACPWWC